MVFNVILSIINLYFVLIFFSKANTRFFTNRGRYYLNYFWSLVTRYTHNIFLLLKFYNADRIKTAHWLLNFFYSNNQIDFRNGRIRYYY